MRNRRRNLNDSDFGSYAKQQPSNESVGSSSSNNYTNNNSDKVGQKSKVSQDNDAQDVLKSDTVGDNKDISTDSFDKNGDANESHVRDSSSGGKSRIQDKSSLKDGASNDNYVRNNRSANRSTTSESDGAHLKDKRQNKDIVRKLKGSATKGAVATAAPVAAKAGLSAAAAVAVKSLIQTIIALIKGFIAAVKRAIVGFFSAVVRWFASVAGWVARALSINMAAAAMMLVMMFGIMTFRVRFALVSHNYLYTDEGCNKSTYSDPMKDAADRDEIIEEAIEICRSHISDTSYYCRSDPVPKWRRNPGVDCATMARYAFNEAAKETVLKKGYNAVPMNIREKISFTVKDGKLDASNLQPGDIMCYYQAEHPSWRHIAVYIGDNELIECTSTANGIRIKSASAHVRTLREVFRLNNLSSPKDDSDEEFDPDVPQFSVRYVKNTAKTTTRNQVVARVYKVLKTAGLTDQAACAIMRNIEKESSFVVDSHDAYSGAAYRLLQMEKGRLDRMKSFCKKKTGNQWNVEAQIEWMLKHDFNKQCSQYSRGSYYWLYDGYGQETGHKVKYTGSYPTSHEHWTWWPKEKYDLKKFSKRKDLNELTEVFCRIFERASRPVLKDRQAYAVAFYKSKTGLDVALANSDLAYENSDDGCGKKIRDSKNSTFSGEADELFFSQLSGSEWADLPYGDTTMNRRGCGIFSIAHAIWLLGDHDVTPKTILDEIKKHGLWNSIYMPNQGTIHGYLGKIARWHDLNVKTGHLTTTSLKKRLDGGAVAVVSSQRSVFKRADRTKRYSGGHYVCIYKYEKGKYYVKDSVVRPKVEYSQSDISLLLSAPRERLLISE